MVQFFGRHEARPRIGGLHAEDAVELRRMAAGLVDLKRRLAGIENERLDATGALRRTQQRDGFFGDPAGVPVELERRDVLVAGRPLVPAERIRVRPVLDLVRRRGRRLNPGAALEEVLLDECAFRRGEELLLPDEFHRAFADRDALDRAHRRIGPK